MPFYVSPEQSMKDKADYARKGIARGRSAVVLQYDGGILFVADNISRTLHKISELYDRIAFAAVGRYNEFENLRQMGVRMADVRGYAYDRSDVSGRVLANIYAQTLGTVFSESNKPWEVEIVVAEVGEDAAADQIYRITFDGSVVDEQGFLAMGGSAEQVTAALKERFDAQAPLGDALNAAMHALRHENGEERDLEASGLEVAVLERERREHRKFRRITGERLTALIREHAAPSSGSDRSGGSSQTQSGSGSEQQQNGS
ncbi:proteasome subunit alpha [Streptomonospora sp. PA3]|uniref:proteasome subunit alpha n=1 Tax=Streptomonospora sp. PA3 TaxID=2607326 RepID=UPI0012DF0CFA|nr:proteasome subunit alpha [Streptomonospora sp. PA3]MUL44180.1 proteasome subunit alpha [Streptomonospora sp. PA3]